MEVLFHFTGMDFIRFMADMDRGELRDVLEGELGSPMDSIAEDNELVRKWIEDTAKLILSCEGKKEKETRVLIRHIYRDPETAVKIRSDDDMPRPLFWLAHMRLKKFIEFE